MSNHAPRAIDVAVMGGGIVGCAAALALVRGGASVALFEATAIGAGASGRNSGSVQHPFDEVLAALHQATLEEYRQLAAEAEGSFSFPSSPAGLLLVAPEIEFAALEEERAAILAADPGLQPELLDPSGLKRLEPAVAPGVAALRLETGYPIPPASAVRAFARLAKGQGTRIDLSGAAMLERREGRVVGVRTADGRVAPAGAVLVAAGPWSPEILDPSGQWRPIERSWGVTVAVRLARPPTHILEQAGVSSINRIGAPAELEGSFDSTFSLITAAGLSVVGSTFLPEQPDPGSVGPLLLHRADRFVPGLHSLGVDELRVCARPQSLDGRPLVGRVPGHDDIFIAAGHGPWGISTGPETARLVAGLILGQDAGIPAELDPARFGAP